MTNRCFSYYFLKNLFQRKLQKKTPLKSKSNYIINEDSKNAESNITLQLINYKSWFWLVKGYTSVCVTGRPHPSLHSSLWVDLLTPWRKLRWVGVGVKQGETSRGYF